MIFTFIIFFFIYFNFIFFELKRGRKLIDLLTKGRLILVHVSQGTICNGFFALCNTKNAASGSQTKLNSAALVLLPTPKRKKNNLQFEYMKQI